jgi:hypothetical protein
MKFRRVSFEKKIDELSKEFDGDFLAIQILDLWFIRYGSKSMPTRTEIGMLLRSHPRITSYHFNTRAKVEGIRGDTRRYRYEN